jgi:hypothetical protein
MPFIDRYIKRSLRQWDSALNIRGNTGGALLSYNNGYYNLL